MTAVAAELPTLSCGQRLAVSGRAAVPEAVRIAGPGHLRVLETGSDLHWSVDGTRWSAVAVRPPRLGESWLALAAATEIRLRATAPLAWSAVVELHCGAPPPLAACVHAIEAAAGQGQAPGVAELAAADPVCAGFARHDLAHRASLSGAAGSAHDAYALAASTWRAAGEARREAAALLGVAEQSSLAGRHRLALLEAVRAAIVNRRVGNAFFAARALQTAAVSASALGLTESSDALGEALLVRYQALGAWNDWATIQSNFGVRAATAGALDEARRRVAAVDSVDPALLTPLTLGRAANLRMNVALAEGRFRQVMELAAKSAQLFEAAGQAGHLVGIKRALANIHRMLGLNAEARLLLQQASALAPPGESPKRSAAILRSYSAIAREHGRFAQALAAIRVAEVSYRQLGLVHEARTTRAERLRIEWLHERDAAAALAGSETGAEFSAGMCPTRAEALTTLGRAAEALALLDAEICRPGALDLALDLASARARALTGLGRREAARAQLRNVAADFDATLGDAGMALQYAVRRRLLRLRDAWVEASDGATPAEALDFALATHAHPARAPASPERPGAASLAIGRALLVDAAESGAEDGKAAEQLVEALARAHAAPGAASAISLHSLQDSLAQDEWLLLWLIGEARSRALWIGADRAHLSELPGRAEIQARLAALLAALPGPRADPGRIDERARGLSDLLFADAPVGAAPARLSVLIDESLATVPLALLPWPGSGAALVESSALSWITAISAAAGMRAAPAATLRIFVADGARGLPALPNARLEPELIAAAAPGLARLAPARGAPQAVLDALQAQDAMVHVAAHGYALPDRLGFAGLWLAPEEEAADTPSFLSWLDLVDHRLQARLAVLNACQLGSTPGNSQGTLSFAAAVANAGVAHVIAASWQASDAATRVWVPAFYRALDPARPESSAAALRAAQLALRDSPHFRHPWFWASLAHYRRLEIRGGALHAQRP